MEPRIQYARTKDGVSIALHQRRELELKGIPEPQRLFAVREEG
jgi:class 3 adenylate cyclase